MSMAKIRKTRFRVAVISIPQDWQPERWDDFPREGTVVSISKQAFRRDRAEGHVFQFNAHCLVNHENLWAVMVHPRSLSDGKHCERRLPLFDIG